MKKLSYLLVPLIVLLCSCGGADKGMNKYYHIPDNHPQTGKAIKMIKNEYIKFDEPYYSIVRYTDLCDDTIDIFHFYTSLYSYSSPKAIEKIESKKDTSECYFIYYEYDLKYECVLHKDFITESAFGDLYIKTLYKYMLVQFKDNKEDTIFTKTFYFDKDLEFWTVSKSTLDYELRNKYEDGKFSWEENK